MSEDTQTPLNRNVEDMVRKIFRHQQRQKYWQIAKFVFFVGLAVSIGLGVFRQVNQILTGISKPAQTRVNAFYKQHIALIDLRGPIWGSFDTAVPGTADSLLPSLSRAFSNSNTVAVILRINSPGGAAVQSSQIFNEIQWFRQKYPQKPIYAVCEEVCASAAYHIASACDKVYANHNSIVGSLGTILGGVGFGYEEALKKLGIERRLFTAGEKKGMLDPYSPLKEEDIQILEEMQIESHRLFIEDVKRGRGSRLASENEKELFSGRAWIGTQAMRLGLVDQLGGLATVANQFKVEIVNYTPQPDWLCQLKKATGFNFSMGALQHSSLEGLAEPLSGLLQSLKGIKDPALNF